ncbi:hypothetical protein HNQ88_002673 [Aureibacter tunicatorum]|uniref:Uncharacterized protein n=1 Tax=Aureibacter tunicatorum TaxID=866807 RepID=A0AAE3XPF6_9BACT|nr:hypothetical protein [Aureibacter tunicatorum]
MTTTIIITAAVAASIVGTIMEFIRYYNENFS